jgi:hypothetical protein
MNKASLIKLFQRYIVYLVLFISISGLFLSSWNSFISKQQNQFLPLAFLFLSYLSLLFLAYHNRSESGKPKNDPMEMPLNKEQRKKNDPSSVISIDSTNIPQRIFGNTGMGDVEKNARNTLKNLAQEFKIMQGVFYSYDEKNENYRFIAGYALPGLNTPEAFKAGVGMHGQAVLDKKIIEISNLPAEQALVLSGLGSSNSKYLYILPIQFKNEVLAVIEFSTVKQLDPDYVSALNQKLEQMGTLWADLNTINEG